MTRRCGAPYPLNLNLSGSAYDELAALAAETRRSMSEIIRLGVALVKIAGRLLALPRDGKPITTWNRRDEALFDVARGVRLVVEELGPVPSRGLRGGSRGFGVPSCPAWGSRPAPQRGLRPCDPQNLPIRCGKGKESRPSLWSAQKCTRSSGGYRASGLHSYLSQPRPVWVTSLNGLTGQRAVS